MDRQGIPLLLIPLLAAFALFYPNTRPTTHESSSSLHRLASNPFVSETGAVKTAEWSDGREMVFNFLGAPNENQAPWSDTDRRSNTKIEFLIATLPDPIESGLPHQFDRQFSSIQAALQGAAGQNFILTNFHLPWLQCLKAAEDKGEKGQSDGKEASANCGSNPSYAREPGVVLFSEPGAAASNGPRRKANLPPLRADTHLLLLYVVGETPTSGIHKAALTTALNEMAWFCGFRPDGLDSRPQWLKGKSDCENIRVIGPTFSGSAQSLDLVLSTWLNSLGELPVASVNMISGSATAVQPWYDFLNLQRIFNKERLKDRSTRTFAFHSMQASNKASISLLQRYIKEIQPCGMRRRIALLSEGNTVYGQTTPQRKPDQESVEAWGDPDSHLCSETEVTSIPFPLHISQLRAALERVRSSQRDAAPKATTNNSEELPLDESLEEVNQRHDSVPPLSQLDTATAELVMSNLLTTISQEKYHYVGILATDVRDVIFLAREIRQHCPETIIFAFNPDLLFLHPEENASLRGMLLVTTYPLFSFNQLWSAPFYAGDANGAESPRARFQFPDQSAQGVYEATLASLGGDSEKQLLEFGIPFDDQSRNPDKYMRPPLWITVVGRNRMWPVRVYDVSTLPNGKWYLNGVSVKSAGNPQDERQLWWRGLYPSGALALLAGVSIGSLIFCGLALRQSRRSQELRPRRLRREGPALEPSDGIALLPRPDEPAPRPHQGTAYLLSACASLTAFITVALSALLVPMMVMFHVDAFHPPKWMNEWGWALAAIVLTAVALSFLIYTSYALIVCLVRQWKQFAKKKISEEDHSSWVQIAFGSAVIFSFCLYLGISSLLQASPSGDFRAALFSSMRSLYLLSGVSPLLPVFLISMAGFVWALGSYFRVRALEAIESEKGFLPLGLELAEVSTLEKDLRSLLHRSALSLPNAYVVVSLVLASGVYLDLAFVRSVESSALYLLLLFSFVLVNLVLWLGVLRFFCVARQMHHLLRQVAWTPLGPACGRLRKELPSLPKIDLASPAPTLSRLMYSVEYAQMLCQRAHSLLVPRPQELHLATAVGGGPLPSHSAESKVQAPLGPVLSSTDVEALQSLSSREFASSINEAESAWKAARDADAKGNMRERSDKKAQSHDALANVTTAVSQTLQASWWKKSPDLLADQGGATESAAAGVYRLGEDFLVGRFGSLLAHILPQMQNLIATSAAGLLLMLLAVSSYPFQPHDILLLFNWAGILAFVGIAMWVFIQMNRDPILSSLNGTEPGQINWNKEFIVRIVMYGIVPILALLGAQFPQSVGQLVSHFIPGEAMHQ